MKQEFRLASLMLVPYAVAALTAVGSATSADGPPATASSAAQPVASAMRAAYDSCREQARLDPSEAARAQRVQQARQDPQARSQRPAWQAQTQADIELCLRSERGGNWAQRRPASAPASL